MSTFQNMKYQILKNWNFTRTFCLVINSDIFSTIVVMHALQICYREFFFAGAESSFFLSLYCIKTYFWAYISNITCMNFCYCGFELDTYLVQRLYPVVTWKIIIYFYFFHRPIHSNKWNIHIFCFVSRKKNNWSYL